MKETPQNYNYVPNGIETEHSFREVRESTSVTFIGHCGWRLGNFMLYYCI